MKGLQFIARYISSSVLLYGGLAFVVAGISIIIFPQILTFGVITPLQIHNLHDLGIGFFIVIFVVVIIGFVSYRNAMKIALEKYSNS